MTTGSAAACQSNREALPLRRRPARRHALVLAAVAGIAVLGGCSAGAPDITGVWVGDDGSGPKVIREDGACSGMYYNAGRVLDIGGSMTCMLGSKGSGGAYTLVVRQPPNQRSYTATFPDRDTLVLSDGSGVVVTLTRQ